MTEFQSLHRGGPIRCVVLLWRRARSKKIGGTCGSTFASASLCQTKMNKIEYLVCQCWVVSLFGGGQSRLQDSPKENATLITVVTNHSLTMLVSEGMISWPPFPVRSQLPHSGPGSSLRFEVLPATSRLKESWPQLHP